MGVWDKVSKGLDRAAKATESALDEGKLRVAAYRARQRADKKAETLGYAYARARAEAREPDADAMQRLVDAVNTADAEARKLEAQTRPEQKAAGAESADATPEPGEDAPQ